jgi:hypothetical protein
MKNYIVHFELTETNRIQLIKMIRNVARIGLREAKEFVEENITNEPRFGFKLGMTELQLGRYLITLEIELREGNVAARGYLMTRFEEIPAIAYIDITALREQ